MEVDKENLRSLSNDDLFKIMKKYGINVGPVNISTRSVYEKKLKNYLESIENGQNPAQSNYSNIEQEKVSVLSASSLEPETLTTKSTFNNLTTNVPVQQPEPVKNKRHTLEPSAFQSSKPTETRQSTILTGIYDDVLSSRSTVTSSSTSSSSNINNSVSSTKTVVAELLSSTHKADTPYPSHPRTQPIQERSKPIETRKPDLDFKLIRPSTPTTVASTNYANSSGLQSNLMSRKDMNRDYGLLDDRQTLSSSHRLQETTTNIRSRTTYSQIDKTVSMNPTRDESKTAQSTAKPQGNSGFNFKYIILIGILFAIVYYLITHIQSNPDNPVEFLN